MHFGGKLLIIQTNRLQNVHGFLFSSLNVQTKTEYDHKKR